ncbi:nitroreductase family protein [Marinilabilia rubra]|uniref:Nitroreductase n=1 Tax=Marinilabilia rubra TaxID=2162893 RepID=A0A2U2B435_9BACT|nr:nitroreductase family protein [Marinilabilia rubra]PWD97825.1 nitroreductase [Marinilabilia rubra]
MNAELLLKERRSINYFDKSKPLSMDIVKEIVDLAVMAPSAFNLQPWRIILVTNPDSKQKLYELANNQDKILEAPVTVVLVGNKEGYDSQNPVWEEMLESVGGHDAIVDGAKQAAKFLYGSSEERKLKFAESNTGLMGMSLMVSAKEFGVDSHPMSGLDFDGIRKDFGLSNEEEVVMAISLGYADDSKELYPRRPRRSFDEIVSVV